MKSRYFIFFLVFIVLTKTAITTKAQAVNVQDSLALVDLYNSTNGNTWYNNDNWLKKPVKKWHGITVAKQRVTSINLFANNLNGNILSSLGTLSELEVLELSENNLAGIIPLEIGNLTNITYLGLYKNKFTGKIPAELGNLKKIGSLDLSSNQLNGEIPIELGELPFLRNLFLSYNQLAGNIPSELFNNSYWNLGLSNNQLSGTIPVAIGVNYSVQYYLDLSNNNLTGTIPVEFGNLSNLETINLSYNNLTGTIPSEFGNLINMISFNLSHNKLQGNIPITLGNLTAMEFCDLSNNELNGTIPNSFGDLYAVEYLYLDSNFLSGVVPSELVDIYYNLRKLNLSQNHFTFDGMELVVKTFYDVQYNSQALIPIHKRNNALYISAGGALNNNTYIWFIVEQMDSTTIVGDSVFIPTQSGSYYAAVNNSICTQLTLYTDTVYYDITLPVNITNLKAYQQASFVKINWTSLTEINVSKYEVQRASNVFDFTNIGSLPAKGNNTQQTDYTFNDLQPLQGNNYYRLKAIDKDGKITYSKTLLVNVRDKAITIVFPIPAKDILHIQTTGNTSFSLFNQNGKILLTKNINGSGIINVSNIAAGIYYLKNNNNSEVKKIVVIK